MIKQSFWHLSLWNIQCKDRKSQELRRHEIQHALFAQPLMALFPSFRITALISVQPLMAADNVVKKPDCRSSHQ